MDTLRFEPYIRAAELASTLLAICIAILWAVGRLGRGLGNVWWLGWGLKVVYVIVLTIVLPAFFAIHYGPHGLLVYLIAGGFLSIALLFAALYRVT